MKSNFRALEPESIREACKSVFTRFRNGIQQHITTYWHAYGFQVFQIGLSDGATLRSQIWPENWKPLQSPYAPMHSHPYSFVAVITKGEILEKRYQIIDEKTDTSLNNVYGTFKIFEVIYKDSEISIQPHAGEAVLGQVQERHIASGESLSVTATDIHEAIPTKLPTEAIILTSSSPQTKSIVVAPTDTVLLPSHPRKPLSQQEIEAHWNRIEQFIAGD